MTLLNFNKIVYIFLICLLIIYVLYNWLITFIQLLLQNLLIFIYCCILWNIRPRFIFTPFTLDVSKQVVRKNIQEIFIDTLIFFTRKNSQFTETKTYILRRYIHVIGNVDIFSTFRIIAHFLKILIRVLSCLLQCKITYTF